LQSHVAVDVLLVWPAGRERCQTGIGKSPRVVAVFILAHAAARSGADGGQGGSGGRLLSDFTATTGRASLRLPLTQVFHKTQGFVCRAANIARVN